MSYDVINNCLVTIYCSRACFVIDGFDNANEKSVLQLHRFLDSVETTVRQRICLSFNRLITDFYVRTYKYLSSHASLLPDREFDLNSLR